MKTAPTKAKQSAAPKAPKGNGAKTSPAPAIGAALDAPDDKWRAEDDMRTLGRAEEIRMDAGRMKSAAECAEKEIGKLAKIKVETSKRTIPAMKSA